MGAELLIPARYRYCFPPSVQLSFWLDLTVGPFIA
jgi:hypothetical protein